MSQEQDKPTFGINVKSVIEIELIDRMCKDLVALKSLLLDNERTLSIPVFTELLQAKNRVAKIRIKVDDVIPCIF